MGRATTAESWVRVVIAIVPWEDASQYPPVPSGIRRTPMPLSEDEQRILRQIEEQFYENDPKFAQHVGSASLYRHALRRVRWAVVGLVVGLVFLVATLQVHFLMSFLGFLGMLGCAFVIERNLRTVGRIGLQDLAGVMRNRRPLDEARLRDKFRRH
jgi:hypothetical protein